MVPGALNALMDVHYQRPSWPRGTLPTSTPGWRALHSSGKVTVILEALTKAFPHKRTIKTTTTSVGGCWRLGSGVCCVLNVHDTFSQDPTFKKSALIAEEQLLRLKKRNEGREHSPFFKKN